jgi:DNA transposition AAA+ family ATPase
MITLTDAIAKSGKSMTAVATALGVSSSQLSLVSNHKYTDWEAKEKDIVERMVASGLILKEDAETEKVAQHDTLRMDPAKFVVTENTMAIDALAKDLLDPATTLNASIGVVYGRAGYGKTTAIRHFCATNDKAVYILYCEGYTLNMLMKAIAREFGAVPCGTFDRNLEQIRQATSVYRRLICIDEADHMPLKVLESIRNVNEECGVPVMLVGEYQLQAKMRSLPRLESRIRSKPVEFTPLSAFDVCSFWAEAVGIDLSGKDDIVSRLLKRSHGDFRLLANDAHRIVSVMNANGIASVSMEVIDGID